MPISDYFQAENLEIISSEEGIAIKGPIDFKDINKFYEALKGLVNDYLVTIDDDLAEIFKSLFPDIELPELPLIITEFSLIKATEETPSQLYFSLIFQDWEWVIFPKDKDNENEEDYFTIKEISIDVAILGTEPSAILQGIVDFEGIELLATVELPSLYMELALQDPKTDTGPSPIQLLKRFDFDPEKELAGKTENGLNKQLKLSQLLVRAMPRDRIFTLNLSIDNIDLDILHLNLATNISYNPGKIYFEFFANLDFDGIKNTPSFSIPIKAVFDHKEAGNEMKFEGGISLRNFTLLEVIEIIGNKLGAPFEFPTFSEQKQDALRLNYMAVAFETPSYNFEFEMELVNLIRVTHADKPIFSLEKLLLHLDYSNDENGKKELLGLIACEMNIVDGLQLIATAEKDPEGWEFTAEIDKDWDVITWAAGIFGLTPPPGLADFKIKKGAKVTYHTGTKAFYVAGESEGAITIPLGSASNPLSISDLSFSFGRNEDKETEFEFSGKTTLDKNGTGKPLEIEVNIKYEDGDWSFEGMTGRKGSKTLGNKIQLGKMLESAFDSTSISLPTPIREFSASEIGISYHTKDKKFNLSALVETEGFPMEGVDASLRLNFNYQGGGTSALGVSGKMDLKNKSGEVYQFALAFGKSADNSTFLASYQGHLTFKKVISILSNDIAKGMPIWLNPEMNGAHFIVTIPSKAEKGKKNRVIFLLKGNLEFNPSNLELVGKFLPDEKVKVDLTMNIVTQALKEEKEIGTIQMMVRDLDLDDVIKIPDEGQEAGFSITANIGESSILPKFDGLNFSTITTGGKSEEQGNKPSSKTEWKEPKQKQFGPVFIKKFGVTLEEGKFKVLVDGGMTLGGFTFRLLDLAVRIPLSMPFDPSGIDFGLAGLELRYKTATASISGAFLSEKVLVDYNGEKILVNGYFGEAMLRFQDKSFTAMGSYINHPVDPSFFLYAVVTMPIGGPSYFYVNGFALGLGINSRLMIPEVDKVRDFVLVKSAFNESQFSDALPESNLKLMQRDIVPEAGSYWIAIGLKVMHVKILQSFFLATVEFGNRVEINLLGLTKLILPPPGDSIVKAELQIKARFVPDEGTLTIEGRLSEDSFILSPDAHLTGGFAFFAWFKGKKAGDFVLSMGGYHPKFKKPPHYPTVPRLGVNWQVTKNILIKGGEYYALTPNSFMAGGRLEASAEVGPVEAFFIAEAHFLVNFSPFQYEGFVNVSLGATFYFLGKHTVRVSAGVELWGPPFAGKAVVDLGLIDVEIEFGPAKKPALPISWQSFSTQFLPPKEKTLMIETSNGLVKELDRSANPENLDWIVNPATLILSFETGIPTQSIEIIGAAKTEDEVGIIPAGKDNKPWKIGIAPMNLTSDYYSSKMTIEVFKGTDSVSEKFHFHEQPTYRREPKALWGKFQDKELDGSQSRMEESLAGISIIPIVHKPEKTLEISVKSLLWGAPENREVKMVLGEIQPGKKFDTERIIDTVTTPEKSHLNAFKNLGIGFEDPDDFTLDESELKMMESQLTYKTTGSILIP